VKTSTAKSWTASDLGLRWGYHPSSVIRVMRRFGFSGMKFGSSKQSARRYADEEVKVVEKLASLQTRATLEEPRCGVGVQQRQQDFPPDNRADRTPTSDSEIFSKPLPPGCDPAAA
jgi:hypothetical protein